MKKKIFIIGICILILVTNSINASNINSEQNKKISENNYIKKYYINDPPNWASGELNGTWGINPLGLIPVELGWMEGCFSVIGIFGKIECDFAEWKNEEPTGYLAGFVIGYYMIGIIGDYVDSNNSTFFVGLGAPNENGEFYYRINLFIGPSWYMTGNWREI